MTEKKVQKKQMPDAEIERRWEEHEKFLNEAYERTYKKIEESIEKHTPAAEQEVLPFLPTPLTRTSPFWPMSKKEMKNRVLEERQWKTSWGMMEIVGYRLSIYDETVLLALIELYRRKYRSRRFLTTYSEILRQMKVARAKDTYAAIEKSLRRLSYTGVGLSVLSPKGKGKKPTLHMSGTIIGHHLSDEETGKLVIEMNPYFLDMYGVGLITNIDPAIRSKINGDIAKALYRFYTSHSGRHHSSHIKTLCGSINVNTDRPMKRIRYEIKRALGTLERVGFLSKQEIGRGDIVHITKKKAGNVRPKKLSGK